MAPRHLCRRRPRRHTCGPRCLHARTRSGHAPREATGRVIGGRLPRPWARLRRLRCERRAAYMTDIADPVLEAYAQAHTTAPEEHLLALAEETRATLSAPQMMVGALEGRFLEMVVYALRPTWLLEFGAFSGYSSLSMAAGLAPGGRITTCELSPVHAEVARAHIARSPYAGLIEVLEGPALDTVAALDGPF